MRAETAVLLLSVAACATPSAILVPVRMDPVTREAIAADWPPPVETLRCLTYQAYGNGEPHHWYITGVRRVRNTNQTQWSVRGECPDSTVTLHDHLPVTCTVVDRTVYCTPGGELAHLCAPSDNDVRYLASRPSQPFNAVRCDARAIVFYRVR